MAEESRTPHLSTFVLGLGLMSTALVLAVGSFALAVGLDDEVTPFIAIAAALVLITILAWRFDALWSKILGLVAGLAVFGLLWFLVFGLFFIFSPLEFIGGLLLLAGFVFTLVGGIRSLIAERKEKTGPTHGEKRLTRVVLTGIGILALVSVAGFFATRESVSEAEAAGAVEVDMLNFEFEPQSSTVSAGGKLVVHNSDPFLHDFTLEALDIAVDVLPGSSTLVDLSGAAPGTYSFVCTIHIDDQGEGMTGTLTISG